ncbi:hypothetical protein [Salipiger mucosus]|uniref:Flagellar protein FliL n=1 Tax=Salipiger mucosus DSM 16094 TaxID=1123237 RepID=S9QEQ2_9RHOB|nr:hypothetical protein [Salipiger mucosus]EPX78038.1 hypothetical protein Salmuc_03360 [Salipiger mucosus DSM 16094]
MKKTLGILLGTVMVFSSAGFAAGTFLIGNGTPAHASTGQETASGDGHGEPAPKKTENLVVEVGRVMVPIYKARSITYVVAQVGLSMPESEEADFFRSEQGATQVRNDIISSMMHLAESPILNGPDIDSDKLSGHVLAALEEDYQDVEDVLFISLTKRDVARG